MRLLLSICIVLGCILMPAQSAWAHAQLLSSDPVANAIFETAPGAVELTFNEPVSPLAIRLISPDGSAVDLTEETSDGAVVSIQIPNGITDGTQVLSWRVVSADGHPIGGSLIFSIGAVTGSATIETSGDRLVSLALWAGKAALFTALFIGIGGATFSSCVPLPSHAKRVSSVLSLCGVVIAPMTLGLQGADALGLPFSSLLDLDTWRTGLSTSYGATAVVLTLAFACSALALRIPAGRYASVLGVVAAVLAALSLALSGHASAAAPQWLTRPAVFLHIGGIVFWVGALVPLWLLLRDPSETATRALGLFSKIIPFAVAALVLSGGTLAVIQMGPPSAAWTSLYGIILGTKVMLLAALFGLALYNRHWLTTPALGGDATASSRLRQSIAWEMALILIILALVAGWRFTPPPRALANVAVAITAEPMVTHFIEGDTMAMVTMTPGSAGPVNIEIMIADLAHAPRDAMAVSVIISNTERGIEPIKREAVEKNGLWYIDDLSIPLAGTWQFEVEARLSRFALSRLHGEVLVP